MEYDAGLRPEGPLGSWQVRGLASLHNLSGSKHEILLCIAAGTVHVQGLQLKDSTLTD